MESSLPTREGSVRRKAALSFAALSLVFLAGLYAGVHQVQIRAQSAETNIPTSYIRFFGTSGNQPAGVDASVLWEVWSTLEQNFIATHASGTLPTTDERLWGAIRGLVGSYGDPYTEFFPPEDAQYFDENISGSFGGVGMEIGAEGGSLTVVAPLKGSPAEKAGVRAGDIIIAIDGEPSEHLEVGAAVKRIRGEKGTPVSLTLSRTGTPQPFTVSIVRDTIEIPSLEYRNNAGTKTFEIDLYNFSGNSLEAFRGALREFLLSGSTNLILDLRGNPGGYLDIAIDMASYFLPPGKVVVIEDYRGNRQNITHRSLGYNVFANKDLNMVILVDGGTASAAEILAGALKEHGVAAVIGTRTFGKGSVQELIDLGDGAELKVTVARWLTPNGSSISDGGLAPTIFATTTAADLAAGRDPQKDAAVQYLVTH